MGDFDKEAERQRPREKYERGETKRRSTQRMSKLLLKGTTVTNEHCDNCDDPLFRYEGQVFYPTCQVEGQATVNANQDVEQAVKTAIETDGSEVEARAKANMNETTASTGSTEAVDETHRNSTDANRRAVAPIRTRTAGEQEAAERHAPREIADDVTVARESLVWTLTWAAERAESTDGPRRAIEYLTAARGAAEAISAPDR